MDPRTCGAFSLTSVEGVGASVSLWFAANRRVSLLSAGTPADGACRSPYQRDHYEENKQRNRDDDVTPVGAIVDANHVDPSFLEKMLDRTLFSRLAANIYLHSLRHDSEAVTRT